MDDPDARDVHEGRVPDGVVEHLGVRHGRRRGHCQDQAHVSTWTDGESTISLRACPSPFRTTTCWPHGRVFRPKHQGARSSACGTRHGRARAWAASRPSAKSRVPTSAGCCRGRSPRHAGDLDRLAWQQLRRPGPERGLLRGRERREVLAGGADPVGERRPPLLERRDLDVDGQRRRSGRPPGPLPSSARRGAPREHRAGRSRPTRQGRAPPPRARTPGPGRSRSPTHTRRRLRRDGPRGPSRRAPARGRP